MVQNMVILTRGGHIWTSFDKGSTFNDITQSLPNLPGGVFIARVVPTASQGAVLIGTNNQDIWSSKDGGRTWLHARTPGGLVDLQPHPVHDSWLAAQVVNPDCFAPASTSCSLDLYTTTDQGDSWALMTTYITEFSWAGAGTQGIHDNQLVAVDWADKSGDFRSKPSDEKRLVHSTTFFHSAEVLARNVLDFLYLHNVFIIAQRDKAGLGLQLLVSENYGQQWISTRFPEATLERVRRTRCASQSDTCHSGTPFSAPRRARW